MPLTFYNESGHFNFVQSGHYHVAVTPLLHFLLHLRELLEDGFEVSVVGDATASAIIPGYDGNQAAQTNFRFIASHVYSTQELKKVITNKKVK